MGLDRCGLRLLGRVRFLLFRANNSLSAAGLSRDLPRNKRSVGVEKSRWSARRSPLGRVASAFMSQPLETDSISQFTSDLSTGSNRFLSRVMQHTLVNAWQTPDEFVEHFGPQVIMRALEKADEVRARLLVKLANVHDRIAAKKSIDSAAEDLRLALEEKVTSPEALMDCFTSDERVRYLKAPEIWKFLFEDSFHKTNLSDGAVAHERAVRRMHFLLECALDEGLVTLQDIADGITFDRVAESLPPEELRKVVTHALKHGRDDEALNEERLLEVVPLPQLLGFVPLDATWEGVILARIAAPQGFAEAVEAPKTEDESEEKSPELRPSRRAAARRSAPPPPPPVAPVPVEAPVTPVTAGEDEARGRAIQRLREIERLPVRLDDLTTPILLSIESMYEDLLDASTDEERAECIRESFPNEGHLRTAMLALAEVLEPSIDVTRPPISDADTEALVKLVVFEERKRKEGDAVARRPSLRPPPLPVGRSASSIPAARVTAPTPGSRNGRE